MEYYSISKFSKILGISPHFGYELVKYIASLYNCEIEIVDNTEESE